MVEFRDAAPYTGPHYPHQYNHQEININGVALCDYSDYKVHVLSITGREIITPKLDTTARQGLDGNRVNSWSLDARTLTVDLLIEDYEQTARRINPLLFGELKLQFSDDNDWYYTGYLQSQSRPRIDRDRQIVTLTFHCPDSWAKSLNTEATGATATIWGTTPYPVQLTTIEATIHTAKPRLIITTNRGFSVTVDRAIAPGEEYVIDWTKAPNVTRNGAPATEYLTLSSDWLELRDKLQNGDTVTAAGATLRVNYYQRRA